MSITLCQNFHFSYYSLCEVLDSIPLVFIFSIRFITPPSPHLLAQQIPFSVRPMPEQSLAHYLVQCGYEASLLSL